MDAHEKIYSVLSKLGYPTEFDTYTGNEKKYITYFGLLFFKILAKTLIII